MSSVVFSHCADLDGVASAILLKAWLNQKGEASTIVFSDYENIASLIATESVGATKVYVADLSIRDASIIDSLSHIKPENIYFFDHHASSKAAFDLWDGKANIELDITGKKCAADLVYEFIMRNGMHYSSELHHLMKCAHSHDLWIKDVEDGDLLTDVISVMGAEKAYELLISNLSLVYSANFTIGMQKCVETTAIAREKSKEMARNTMSMVDCIGDSKVIVAFTTGYQSDVGDMLLKNYSLAWTVLIDMARCSASYRTNRETIQKYGVSVNQIAEHFGGGGHPMASGSPMPEKVGQMGTFEFAKKISTIVKALHGN